MNAFDECFGAECEGVIDPTLHFNDMPAKQVFDASIMRVAFDAPLLPATPPI